MVQFTKCLTNTKIHSNKIDGKLITKAVLEDTSVQAIFSKLKSVQAIFSKLRSNTVYIDNEIDHSSFYKDQNISLVKGNQAINQ